MKLRGTRLRIIGAAAAGVMLLSACNRQPTNASSASAEKPLIGMSVQFIAGNSWLSTLAAGAVRAGKDKGYDVQTVDAQGNASQQIQQMQTFINKGAKAIIIEPVGDRNVEAGITAAKRAGIPVIVVNDRVSAELASQVACNVYDDGSATAKLVGTKTAEVAASRFPSGTAIKLYIQALFPQSLVTQVRENGFMDGWNGYFATHPGYTTKRIPNNYGSALPDKTLAAMRNVLAGNPNVNVIFNQTDVVNSAVFEALKGAGLMQASGKSDVIIAGFDGGMDVVKAMSGDPNSPLVATGLNQPATQASYAVDEAIAAVTKKPTGLCNGATPTRILPPVIVDKANAATFVDPTLAFAGTK